MNMESQIPLSRAAVGDHYCLTRIEVQGILRRRLLDLGFVPGNRIDAVRRSPLGDPIAFRVNNTVIALRKEESALIFGYKTGGTPHG